MKIANCGPKGTKVSGAFQEAVVIAEMFWDMRLYGKTDRQTHSFLFSLGHMVQNTQELGRGHT